MASIQKTRNGTWRVQIENRGRRFYKTFPTKALAIAWGNKRETELAEGHVLSASEAERTPFSLVIAAFRDRELPKLRNRSYKFMLNTLDERFGRHRLINLQKKDFAAFRDDRLKEGKAPATVLKELNLARRLIDYAVDDLDIHLPGNTARKVDNPKVNDARHRVFIDDSEEARLFAAFPNQNYRDIGVLALETACRLGELLKMQWHHVDFAKRVVAIPKANTKTEIARVVPLSTKALSVLERTPRRKRHGRVFGCWAAGDSFENGYRRAVNRARATYEDECKQARKKPHPDMLVDLRFHDFRHIATSRLAKVFPNVIVLSRVTGHSDLKMLSRYYHVSADELVARLG